MHIARARVGLFVRERAVQLPSRVLYPRVRNLKKNLGGALRRAAAAPYRNSIKPIAHRAKQTAGSAIEGTLTKIKPGSGKAWDAAKSTAEEITKQAAVGAEKLGAFAAEAHASFDATLKRQTKARSERAWEGISVPRWYILAGLGALDRRTLCDFLAVFENTSLANLSLDGARDLCQKLRRSDRTENERAFARRIRRASDEYMASSELGPSDAWLRFRIWSAIRSAFDLAMSLPLATESANQRSAEVAEHASENYRVDQQSGHESDGLASKLGRGVARSKVRLRSSRRIDFTRAVHIEASRCVLRGLDGDDLTPAQRQTIVRELRQRLDQLPSDLRNQPLDQAIRSGDFATVAALASSGSLVGLGIAVEIAGFSAYIAAAKASAVIPLLCGKTAVSALAVLSDPVFVVLGLAGGGFAMSRSQQKKICRAVASSLAVQLALRGLASRVDGLKECLDGFKCLGKLDTNCTNLVAWRERVKAAVGPLQPTPGVPKTELPAISDIDGGDALTTALFPGSKSSVEEGTAVAALTTADVLFDAVAIDPLVISAADFSRVEDLDGIFKFGAFAEQLESMGEIAREGAENHLRGYVAEMMVATRLKGHDVSLPDNPNTPGYDLVVDGNPFQVKCHADADTAVSAMRDHFERYPDIPVYVNSEVLPAVQESGEPWIDSVFGVEGFDYETINEILEESLRAAADLMDVRAPIFAIAVSAARNIHGWWKGSISLRDLPLEVVVDGALRGSLAIAGGFTGRAIGLLLFGPAGAVIFGGAGEVGVIFGASEIRRRFDDLLAREWAAEVRVSADRFRTALDKAMRWKIASIDFKASKVEASDQGFAEWLRLKFADQALHVAECKAQLEDLREKPIDRANELLRLMHEAGVHHWSVRGPLRDLLDVLARRPTVTDHAADMIGKGKEFLAERPRANGQRLKA